MCLDKICGINAHLKYFDVLVFIFCQNLYSKWLSKTIHSLTLKALSQFKAKAEKCADVRQTDKQTEEHTHKRYLIGTKNKPAYPCIPDFLQTVRREN